MPETSVPNRYANRTISLLESRGCRIIKINKNFTHTYIVYQGGAVAPISRPVQESNASVALKYSHIPHKNPKK